MVLDPRGAQQLQTKLILTYDPIPEQREAYFRYVLGEFVPTMEQMGLRMCESWHTAYGSYPLRLQGFTADDNDAMAQILDSRDFKELEERLQEYVVNYQRRVVLRKKTFQF